MKIIPIPPQMIEGIKSSVTAIQQATQLANFYQQAGAALQNEFSRNIQQTFNLDPDLQFTIDLETQELRFEESSPTTSPGETR